MAQQKRPPVITIMGHVDHGKTTLLDYLRKSSIAAKESGGITQHIGAYQVEFKGQKITFLDTPGHAAFHKMRERGAKITDIVILVVAANDGVKPQTLEAIRHITEAKVPVVVAINKIDLPDVRPEVAKSQLAEHGILISEYGGDVEAVEISALKGTNIDKLLETVTVMADLQNLQADPDAPLRATVIESTKSAHQGPVASVVVQQGTLRLRQDIFTHEATGRVKKMTTDRSDTIESVTPGCPAQVIGFTQVPSVGSVVVDAVDQLSLVDIEIAQEPQQAAAFDFLASEAPKINLIIKADVEGTLEAITQQVDPESVQLLSSGVGDVTDQDLELALTSGALVLAFRVGVPGRIKRLAKENGVRIKKYDVIYHLIEDLQKQMMKLLEPTIDEKVLGEAEILQIFEMRGDKIAGCKVKTGEIKKTDKFHLKRGETIIGDPTLKSMMRGKEEVTQVKAKIECGLTFRQSKLDFQVGDILVAYKLEDDE